MVRRNIPKFYFFIVMIFLTCSMSNKLSYRLQLDALHTDATDFYMKGDCKSAVPVFEELVQADSTLLYPNDRVALHKCYLSLSRYNSADKLMESTLKIVEKPENAAIKNDLNSELAQLLENYKAAKFRKAEAEKWIAEKKSEGDSTVVVPYDKEPEPVGGFASIHRNLVYPEHARINQIERTVFVYAHIQTDGSVGETKIMEPVDDGLDEAACQAVETVKWIPARKDNNPVAVWVSVPVRFRLK